MTGAAWIPLRERMGKEDCIAELERACLDRFDDSIVLATRARWDGAVYLLGYYVEMALKAAFFRCFGYTVIEAIRAVDLRAASELVRKELLIEENPENQHNPMFWARALVQLRETLGTGMPVSFSRELLWRCKRVYSSWAVRMRYTAGLAEASDWRRIREDAMWIRGNVANLAILPE